MCAGAAELLGFHARLEVSLVAWEKGLLRLLVDDDAMLFEIRDIDSVQKIADRLNGLVATCDYPVLFLLGEASAVADGGTVGRAVDDGGSVAFGGFAYGSDGEVSWFN